MAEPQPLLRPPRVSIVMPVYNGGRYFELALQSALAQTYHDFEIVIVDDGSTDAGATQAIGARYAAEQPDKVRYIRQDNTGVSGALNTGIREMTGDIFCWLSHDDLFTPEKTAVQADVWRRIGRPNAMLISDYGVIGPEGELIAAGAFEHELFLRAPRLPIYRGGIHGCTVFIPVDLLRRRAEPFDPALRFTGDYTLWAELLRERDFFHVPRSLVLSRRHPDQDSRRPDVAGEGEALWRRMVDELSDVEKTQLYGSAWRFFDETHKKLLRSPYQDTAAYLAHSRDACLERTLISVVVCVGQADDAERTLRSVLGQTHACLEVLVIGESPGATGPYASHPQVRFYPSPRGGLDDARNLGLARARGAYVAFAVPDAEWRPDRLERSLALMAEAGAVISPGGPGAQPGSPLPPPPIDLDSAERILESLTAEVMVHRSLLAGGLRFGASRSA